jgi:hypothetical protein
MIFLHDVTGESAVDAGSVDIVYADTLYGTGRMFSYNDERGNAIRVTKGVIDLDAEYAETRGLSIIVVSVWIALAITAFVACHAA